MHRVFGGVHQPIHEAHGGEGLRSRPETLHPRAPGQRAQTIPGRAGTCAEGTEGEYRHKQQIRMLFAQQKMFQERFGVPAREHRRGGGAALIEHIREGVPLVGDQGELGARCHVSRVGGSTGADGGPAGLCRAVQNCEVDEFTRIAADVVGEAQGYEAVEKVVQWVNGYLSYVPGSSTITDSARSTYVARQGVCRDYAHLTATVLRAAGVPARCVAVYAPGLSPMDFHLVVEALVDGAWWVVDATGLAPRSSMVRIASGQDAADTAFMTTTTGHVELTGIQVGAVVDPDLPREDGTERLPLR